MLSAKQSLNNSFDCFLDTLSREKMVFLWYVSLLFSPTHTLTLRCSRRRAIDGIGRWWTHKKEAKVCSLILVSPIICTIPSRRLILSNRLFAILLVCPTIPMIEAISSLLLRIVCYQLNARVWCIRKPSLRVRSAAPTRLWATARSHVYSICMAVPRSSEVARQIFESTAFAAVGLEAHSNIPSYANRNANLRFEMFESMSNARHLLAWKVIHGGYASFLCIFSPFFASSRDTLGCQLRQLWRDGLVEFFDLFLMLGFSIVVVAREITECILSV